MALRDELPKIITSTLPGPKSKELFDRRAKATPPAIRCGYPVAIKRGEGAMVEDLDGNYFLDWVGGVGVLNLGYSNPEVIDAVKAQADNYFHAMFNIMTHEGYVALAEKISAIAPVKGEEKMTFFANSGAESDENAVKLAKAYTKRPNIIVFTGAFHGRTALTMAMTSKKAYAVGMGPFPDGVYRAPYPYLYRKPEGMTDEDAIAYYIKKLDDVFEEASPAEYVAAIVLEPLQGEGGFIPAPIEWVKAVRQICDEKGICLVVDEVQSGWCRTGRMFASDYWKEAGVQPDILSTAKSIAGGLPLGAIVARKEIVESVPGGVIGGTFGGNALSCAAALKAIEIYERDDYAAKSQRIGSIARETMESWKDKYTVVGDVRGLGGMIGIEFVKDKTTKEPATELVGKLVAYCAQHGLIIENAGTYSNVVRFLAPLCITDEQLKAGLKIMEEGIIELS